MTITNIILLKKKKLSKINFINIKMIIYWIDSDQPVFTCQSYAESWDNNNFTESK
jgi:hypothetical protein